MFNRNLEISFFTLKYADAAQKIRKYKIDSPSMIFFVKKYENAGVVDWNKIANKQQLEEAVRNAVRALAEKFDESSENNNFIKYVDIRTEYLNRPNFEPVRDAYNALYNTVGSTAGPVYEKKKREIEDVLITKLNAAKKESFSIWWDNINNDYKDHPGFQYCILEPIFDSSPATEEFSPPAWNKAAVETIFNNIEASNGGAMFKMIKEYRTQSVKAANDSEPASTGGWLHLPSGKKCAQDPAKWGDFKKHVKTLMTYGNPAGWCVGGESTALSYLGQGDFWLYIKDGKAVVAIRFGRKDTDRETEDGKEVKEIQGVGNNYENLKPYWKEVTDLFVKNKEEEEKEAKTNGTYNEQWKSRWMANNDWGSHYSKLMTLRTINLGIDDPQRRKEILDMMRSTPDIWESLDKNNQETADILDAAIDGYHTRYTINTRNLSDAYFSDFDNQWKIIPEKIRLGIAEKYPDTVKKFESGLLKYNGTLATRGFTADIIFPDVAVAKFMDMAKWEEILKSALTVYKGYLDGKTGIAALSFIQSNHIRYSSPFFQKIVKEKVDTEFPKIMERFRKSFAKGVNSVHIDEINAFISTMTYTETPIIKSFLTPEHLNELKSILIESVPCLIDKTLDRILQQASNIPVVKDKDLEAAIKQEIYENIKKDGTLVDTYRRKYGRFYKWLVRDQSLSVIEKEAWDKKVSEDVSQFPLAPFSIRMHRDLQAKYKNPNNWIKTIDLIEKEAAKLNMAAETQISDQRGEYKSTIVLENEQQGMERLSHMIFSIPAEIRENAEFADRIVKALYGMIERTKESDFTNSYLWANAGAKVRKMIEFLSPTAGVKQLTETLENKSLEYCKNFLASGQGKDVINYKWYNLKAIYADLRMVSAIPENIWEKLDDLIQEARAKYVAYAIKSNYYFLTDINPVEGDVVWDSPIVYQAIEFMIAKYPDLIKIVQRKLPKMYEKMNADPNRLANVYINGIKNSEDLVSLTKVIVNVPTFDGEIKENVIKTIIERIDKFTATADLRSIINICASLSRISNPIMKDERIVKAIDELRNRTNLPDYWVKKINAMESNIPYSFEELILISRNLPIAMKKHPLVQGALAEKVAEFIDNENNPNNLRWYVAKLNSPGTSPIGNQKAMTKLLIDRIERKINPQKKNEPATVQPVAQPAQEQAVVQAPQMRAPVQRAQRPQYQRPEVEANTKVLWRLLK